MSDISSLNSAEQAALIQAADMIETAARLKAEADEAARTSITELEARIAELKLTLPTEDPFFDVSDQIPDEIGASPDLTGSNPITTEKTSNRTNDRPSPSLGAKISTYHDLIGVPDFLENERSDVELEHSSMQIISKADRLRLSASDKSKVYANFIKGSTNKFKASSTIVGLDEISTIENITSFSELRLELQKHITGISVHPVFLILKFDDFGNPIDPDSPKGAPTNLLSVNSLPTLSDVEKSVLFHHKRGSAFNHENLVWSFEAVRNSCDKELQSIIDAKMLKYKSSERFGPLYYYELVQQMTNVDSKAVRAITRELTSLNVAELEGQSIANVASTIRSTLIWLEMVNMVPPDIDAVVYDILETCTVPDFQLYLKTLITNAALNDLKLSHKTLLEKAENHYRTLIISKKWDAAGPQGSSFQAQQHRAQRNGPSTSGGQTSSTNRPPRANMPTWHRTAPADGEPHEKTFEDKIFKWCGTCQRWFFGHRGHFTHEHIQGHSTTRRGRPAPNSTSTSAPSANAVTPLAPSTVPNPSINAAISTSSAPSTQSTASRNYLFTGGL